MLVLVLGYALLQVPSLHGFPYLSAHDFFKIPVWNIKFDEFDVWSISNWNFAGYKGSKYQVQTRKKIKFINLDIPNWNFAEMKCR